MMRGTAAAAILTVAILAGCTSASPTPNPSSATSASASASAEPTAPASPTPTPSPTTPAVTKPEPPADLARTDEAGAAAAATYFLELYAYTLQSGDVAMWDAMSSDVCKFCSGTRDLALSLIAGGETYTGSEIRPEKTFVYPLDDLIGAYPVDVDFTQSPGVRTDASGQVVNKSLADSGTFGVDVVSVQGNWRVLAVTDQEK